MEEKGLATPVLSWEEGEEKGKRRDHRGEAVRVMPQR
jgi:hypothetical protein